VCVRVAGDGRDIRDHFAPFGPSQSCGRLFAGLLAQEMLFTFVYVRSPTCLRSDECPALALTFFAFIEPVNIHSSGTDFYGRKHRPKRREASVYQASCPPLTTVNKFFIISALVNIS